MKKFYFGLMAILCASIALSQNFKFGKVSKAELEESIHKFDSSASAAVLYKKENITFIYTNSDGFMQQREVHERIKIYNKEGFEWATKKLYLYEGGAGSKEKVKNLKGVTYNLENGKITKDKLTKDGIFEEDYNEYTEVDTFTMPNIKEGSVIEYSYMIYSPFISIDDVIFQYDIPINKLDFSVATPEYYRYNTQFNLKSYYIPKLIESKNSKSAYIAGKKDYVGSGMGGADQSTQGGTMEYKDNILKVSDENIAALKVEAYSGNINQFRSKMSMELTARVNSYGAIEKAYSTNWEKVTKSIYDSPSFGNQLKRTGFFEDVIAPLLEGVASDFQKAFIIQSFVKSKVKWNGNYGFTAQKGTKEAYKSGEGNIGDVNLLLVAMLKSQGVNAYPVLVSTKNNGVPLFPTRNGFNYVICLVSEGDNYILLDASEIFSMINVLPKRALNWQGRVIRENGTSSWISLRPTQPSTESTSLNVQIHDDLTITGKVRQNITDHMAMDYRDRYTAVSADDHIKAIESGKGDIEISELNFENDRDITQPVKLSYDYELSDAIDDIGGKIYFSPLLFFTKEESPFKLNERQYPIDFVMPMQEKYLVNIMIPEGYKVEALPQSERLDFKNGEVQFSYVAKENGKYLQFSINFNLKNSLIDPQNYKDFKEFYSKIIEKQAEQVVLTKA